MYKLNDLDREECDKIRRYGEFIARYDMNENNTKNYDDTQSILVYEYEETTYYIVMERGEYINYFFD